MSVLKRHVETHAPPHTRLTFTPLPFRANPYIMPRDTVANRAAAKVVSFFDVCTAPSVSLNCGCTDIGLVEAVIHSANWQAAAGAARGIWQSSVLLSRRVDNPIL